MMLGSLQQKWPKEPTEHQLMHQNRISEACELLRAYMHEAEGSTMPPTMGEHRWTSRRMSIAATQLEMAELFARLAALES